MISYSSVYARSISETIMIKSDIKSLNDYASQIKSREVLLALLLTSDDEQNLILKINEEDESFNAFATFDDFSNPLIIVNKGLLSHHLMTKPMLDMFLCHEMGHLSGGDPKIIRRNGKESWSSVEGQADYFATSVCMEALGYDESEILSQSILFSQMISQIKGVSVSPQVDTPDRTVVTRIVQGHPTPQCRLDTLIAGLKKDQRPRCWYIFKE